MHSFITLLALFAVAQVAHAQAFKCKVDGKVVYQGTPCPSDGAKVNLTGAGESNQGSAGPSYLAREGARMDFEERVDVAIRNQKVFVGMTSAHVKKSWGEPTSINKTLSASTLSEQWVYRRGRVGDSQYVYLKNGIVDAVQSP